MTARLIMVQGVSSNAGKSILTGALCRYLSNRGVRVAPFKPLLVCTGDAEENGQPTDARFLHSIRAARLELSALFNPMQIVPKTRDWLGQIMSPATLRFAGGDCVEIPLFGRDTPLFTALPISLRARITHATRMALDRLRTQFDVVIVEGAGNPTDLGEDDLTNFEVARHYPVATMLVTKLSVGGGPASLAGTFELLPNTIRQTIVGFVLNDFLDGKEIATRLAEHLAARLGVPCLGVYPNLWSLRPWACKDEELEGLGELVGAHLDLRPLGLDGDLNQ